MAKTLKKGQWIRFSALDDMTAQPIELVGEVLGFAEDFASNFRTEFELEMCGIDYYIVRVPRPGYSTKHLIHISDFLRFETERSV